MCVCFFFFFFFFGGGVRGGGERALGETASVYIILFVLKIQITRQEGGTRVSDFYFTSYPNLKY